MDNFMNEPISCESVDELLAVDYKKGCDVKSLARIYDMTVAEIKKKVSILESK